MESLATQEYDERGNQESTIRPAFLDMPAERAYVRNMTPPLMTTEDLLNTSIPCPLSAIL